jgi:hypothetical protein
MNLICCHVATNMQDQILHYINKILLLGKRKTVTRNAFRFSPKIGPVFQLIFQENIWGGSKLRKKEGSYLTGGGSNVPISLTQHWVGQQFRERPLMICHICCHGWGLGPEDSIFAAAERFVGPDQIVAGHADGKLGFQPAHRTSNGRSLACKMRVP